MAMMATLWTMKGLATETRWTERRIASILVGVTPDGQVGGRKAWLLHTLLEAADKKVDATAEKARLDKARAELAELDLEIRKGKVIPAEYVTAAWGAIVSEVRTRLMSVPAAAAPRIMPKMTTVEVEAIIRDHIDEAISAIRNAVLEPGNDHDPATSGPVERGSINARAVQVAAATKAQ